LLTWVLCSISGALLISIAFAKAAVIELGTAIPSGEASLILPAASGAWRPKRIASDVTRPDYDAGQPQLKTASSHPIQYYLSLPDGWVAGKKYPVVIVIESADREFQKAATLFSRSPQRGRFILVTPLVVTNGGSGYRNVPSYHYSDAVWSGIQNSGDFT